MFLISIYNAFTIRTFPPFRSFAEFRQLSSIVCALMHVSRNFAIDSTWFRQLAHNILGSLSCSSICINHMEKGEQYVFFLNKYKTYWQYTHNHWQTHSDLPNQINLTSFVRENVCLRPRTARTKTTQLKVVYASISGRSHGWLFFYLIVPKFLLGDFDSIEITLTELHSTQSLRPNCFQ